MNNEPMLEVVVFRLASERCAVESAYVREVHPVTELTPLPCTPTFLAGVMNVRGGILAVFDLAVLFGLTAAPVESLTHVIVVDHAGLSFGILADASTETASLPSGELEVSPPSGCGIPAPVVKGVAKDRLIVLDLPGVAQDKRLLVYDQVM